ncbi:acetyl-CoA carboxylase carboxyltransferase subunit beta [Phaeovibrio sulfidiphilus]|uniref:Acetyl-coenzyme A carboxylase carboxyl transferase subunit beta n=1 Tax=Phaeovibrio sulfidiphilus TaxID=1220600 RepID=A0A8J6YN26_9PROT|nr:acetyl-CoA carboxylase, carboxyltransferase subunit beta [Phaeovibrio sulfidiphilus]MBE1237505.1 acetyl-CoA carboxylase carboxyltransferase subunit beta [Phaeovibrio sulfidiphilus]
MNWLTNLVRPKIRNLVPKKDVPENLWVKCPSCEHMLFRKDVEKSSMVCSRCGHHMRLPARKRLEMLFDGGNYTEIQLPVPAPDPLKFKDLKKYPDRLKDAQTKTGEKDALIVAHGWLAGMPVVVAAFNFDFMGGSMGVAVGEGLVQAAEVAVQQRAALIVIPASGGARMQEGILSLMQMARSTVAVQRVREARLPYIVLLTDPTTGGVTASFAMLGDVTLSEPGAVIGFAGARVIENTIRQKLPEGFQRAEYLRDHGMVDLVVHRKDIKSTIARIISIMTHRDAPSELAPAYLSTVEETDSPLPLPPPGDPEAAARADGRPADPSDEVSEDDEGPEDPTQHGDK